MNAPCHGREWLVLETSADVRPSMCRRHTYIFFKRKMMIRPAKISDAIEMHRIHTSAVTVACKDFYTDKQIKGWLKGRSPEGYLEGINKGDMYVAELDHKVVGFGHAVHGEVVAVFVDPAFHNMGIGKNLLDYGLKIASKNQKTVKVESSLNAENFYKKYGFVKIRNDVCLRNGIELPIVVLEYYVQR